MKYAAALSILLFVVVTSQAVRLPPKKLTDSVGLLRRHMIKMQPKELVDECEDCQPLPLPQDLNVRKLMKLIGGRLNNVVVSISKPHDFTTSKLLKSHTGGRKREIQEYVAKTTKKMAHLGQVTPKQKSFLVDWLLEQSSCPMKIEWRDMGPFSWPRYVKRVFCVGKTCSMEPGMRCTASARRTFPLLRWYCLDASHKDVFPPWLGKSFVERDGYFCRWIKFRYPITTRCSCKCDSN